MKYLVLLLFTCCLAKSINNSPHSPSKTRTFFKLSKTEDILTKRNYIVYKKSLTGDKTKLPKLINNSFQKYGLYHLLTPSGLHLSSLFFINILPMAIQVIILTFILFTILPMQSYFSLERIIIYKLIFYFGKFYLNKYY